MVNRPAMLAEKLEEWRVRPFAWGSADCLQFVGDVVAALTGVDHRPRFGVYSTQAGAEALLAAHGGISGILTECLGPAKPPAQACRGDVVTADFGRGVTAGICSGVSCFAPGERGLEFRPMSVALAAWSV